MNVRVLGIESSCDETAAAVVEGGVRVLSSAVATQHELHERFGGVVPEIACRAHVRSILPVIDEALSRAGVATGDLDGVAVTTTPGLIGALLVGVSAAKALSWALELPLLSVNHLQAHIYPAWIESDGPALPAVSLVVSGGHTSLFLTEGPLDHRLLGATVDDAAGEVFDKVARILKLGYPGGPAVERAARDGNAKSVRFPRSLLGRDSLDFSFSGLKTAVLYHCLGSNPSRDDIENAVHAPAFVSDVAAAFQQAVVDVLAAKVQRAAERECVRSVIVGGGVAANGPLRERLETECGRHGLALHLAPREFCTDNAVMTAGLGCRLLEAGRVAALDVEAVP